MLELTYASVQISVLERPFLNVNCAHLRQLNRELYTQLVCYPQEVIPIFDLGANDLFQELYQGVILPHQIQVRSILGW